MTIGVAGRGPSGLVAGAAGVDVGRPAGWDSSAVVARAVGVGVLAAGRAGFGRGSSGLVVRPVGDGVPTPRQPGTGVGA